MQAPAHEVLHCLILPGPHRGQKVSKGTIAANRCCMLARLSQPYHNAVRCSTDDAQPGVRTSGSALTSSHSCHCWAGSAPVSFITKGSTASGVWLVMAMMCPQHYSSTPASELCQGCVQITVASHGSVRNEVHGAAAHAGMGQLPA